MCQYFPIGLYETIFHLQGLNQNFKLITLKYLFYVYFLN